MPSKSTSRVGGKSAAVAVTRAFRGGLLDWFDANRRVLPWRSRRTPYRVWISELMLQQTRADQATPYFVKFVKRFPTVRALASADRGDVLKMWEGLGYYSRAIRAHETAKYLAAECNGKFPATYDGLMELPGIGPYTAAAVASLAFGLDHAVLDGNVIRVLARVFAVSNVTDLPATRRAMQERLDQLLPKGKAALFNEAMMELGALVCTPANPDCARCPLRTVCAAYQMGTPVAFPVRRKKKTLPHRHVGAGVIVDDKGRILIAQRKESSMLGGLWEFPGGGVEVGESLPDCIRRELKEELDLDVRIGPHLVTVRHTFSHFRMDLHAYWVRICGGRPKPLHCADFAWVDLESIDRYAFPRADQKILASLRGVAKWPEF